jgi:predicted amino acid racemase
MRAKVTVNLDHIKYNSYLIQNNCKRFGVEVAAVTKNAQCFGTDLSRIGGIGVRILADSRIENLQSIQQIPCEKWCSVCRHSVLLRKSYYIVMLLEQ